jgi:hypothetical protein
LEFKDKERLAEFFQKTRKLYPDSLRRTNRIFLSGDHVITAWVLQATLTEPFYGLLRKAPVSVHGTSIERIDDEKITDWADYDDGLTSRCPAQDSHFTEGVEL